MSWLSCVSATCWQDLRGYHLIWLRGQLNKLARADEFRWTDSMYGFSRRLRQGESKRGAFPPPSLACFEFLGPGRNVNQDATPEESEIKENLIHLMKLFGVLCRMTQPLRDKHQQNLSGVFFSPFGALTIFRQTASVNLVSNKLML